MPIYAYKCESCGYAKDALQKMSDAPLSVCPECGAATFKKQLTSAGFQLKGSGWYVTDFRGDNGAKPAKPADGDSSSPTPVADSKPAESGSSAAPAAAAPAPKPAPVAAAPVASGNASAKTP